MSIAGCKQRCHLARQRRARSVGAGQTGADRRTHHGCPSLVHKNVGGELRRACPGGSHLRSDQISSCIRTLPVVLAAQGGLKSQHKPPSTAAAAHPITPHHAASRVAVSHQRLLQRHSLRRHQRGIPSAAAHQLRVRALFHHPAGVQHNNLQGCQGQGVVGTNLNESVAERDGCTGETVGLHVRCAMTTIRLP